MCYEAVNWAWKQQLQTVGQKLVLLCLAHRINKDNRCWPSVKYICQDTGMKERGVRKILKELRDLGLIICSFIPGRASVYTISYSGTECSPVPECRPVPQFRPPCTTVQDTPALECKPPTPPLKENIKRTKKEPKGARACEPDSESLILPGMEKTLDKPEKPDKPDKPESPDKPDKPNKPVIVKPKRHFGEFGNVLLTEQEHDKLVQEYGAADTEAAIRFLDLHIGGRKGGDPYKSHYMAMKKWVYNAVFEQQRRAGGNSRASPAGYVEQRNTWQQMEDERKKQEFFDLVDQRKTNKPAWMPTYD